MLDERSCDACSTCHHPCKSQSKGPFSSGALSEPLTTIVADDKTGTCAAAARREGSGGGRNIALNHVSQDLPGCARVTDVAVLLVQVQDASKAADTSG
jgi:hypothetical protein